MEHLKTKVNYLIKRYETNDPYKLAALLGIQVVHKQLGNTWGFYSKYFRIKTIHINEALGEEEQLFVCAHELGHALQHCEVNTPFLKKNTLFSTERIEMEANFFAIYLLFHDETLFEQITIDQALHKYGISKRFIKK
ncbi:MAG: ImmA/IrrE family metallo-endopeptidase [Psychrobacillus psychrodurans]